MTERVLYEKTGNIRDVNTVLVPLDKLRELQAEAARYRWIRDRSRNDMCDAGVDLNWYAPTEGLDAAIDAALGLKQVGGALIDVSPELPGERAYYAALAPASPHKESQ